MAFKVNRREFVAFRRRRDGTVAHRRLRRVYATIGRRRLPGVGGLPGAPRNRQRLKKENKASLCRRLRRVERQ